MREGGGEGGCGVGGVGARKMQHLPCTRMQEATMPLQLNEKREKKIIQMKERTAEGRG